MLNTVEIEAVAGYSNRFPATGSTEGGQRHEAGRTE